MIYADLKCLLEKIESCQNDSEKSSREKKAEIHLQVTHGLDAVYLMNQKTNGVITEKKAVWKCFVNLRNQATKIINYEKKEIIQLTDEENKSYESQKVCYICEKRVLHK